MLLTGLMLMASAGHLVRPLCVGEECEECADLSAATDDCYCPMGTVDRTSRCTDQCHSDSNNCMRVVGSSLSSARCSEEDQDCRCQQGYAPYYNLQTQQIWCSLTGCDPTLPGAAHCQCSDSLDMRTCQCEIGFAPDKSRAGYCNDLCSPRDDPFSNCFMEGTVTPCYVGSMLPCKCGSSYVPTGVRTAGVSGWDYVSCEAVQCSPLLDPDKCSCSDPFDSQTCACQSGFASDPHNPGNCTQVQCLSGEDFCTCSDSSNALTCSCDAGYVPGTRHDDNEDYRGTCTNNCNHIEGIDDCYRSNSDGAACSTQSPQACQCGIGYVLQLVDAEGLVSRCVKAECDPSRHTNCACTDKTDMTGKCKCEVGYARNGTETVFGSSDEPMSIDPYYTFWTTDTARCVKDCRNGRLEVSEMPAGCSCLADESLCLCASHLKLTIDDSFNPSCMTGAFACNPIDVATGEPSESCVCKDPTLETQCDCIIGYYTSSTEVCVDGVCNNPRTCVSKCTYNPGNGQCLSTATGVTCTEEDDDCYCATGYAPVWKNSVMAALCEEMTCVATDGNNCECSDQWEPSKCHCLPAFTVDPLVRGSCTDSCYGDEPFCVTSSGQACPSGSRCSCSFQATPATITSEEKQEVVTCSPIQCQQGDTFCTCPNNLNSYTACSCNQGFYSTQEYNPGMCMPVECTSDEANCECFNPQDSNTCYCDASHLASLDYTSMTYTCRRVTASSQCPLNMRVDDTGCSCADKQAAGDFGQCTCGFVMDDRCYVYTCNPTADDNCVCNPIDDEHEVCLCKTGFVPTYDGATCRAECSTGLSDRCDVTNTCELFYETSMLVDDIDHQLNLLCVPTECSEGTANCICPEVAGTYLVNRKLCECTIGYAPDGNGGCVKRCDRSIDSNCNTDCNIYVDPNDCICNPGFTITYDWENGVNRCEEVQCNYGYSNCACRETEDELAPVKFIEEQDCECEGEMRGLADGTCQQPVVETCYTCTSQDWENACAYDLDKEYIRDMVSSPGCDRDTGYGGCWSTWHRVEKDGVLSSDELRRSCGHVCTDSFVNGTYCLTNHYINPQTNEAVRERICASCCFGRDNCNTNTLYTAILSANHIAPGILKLALAAAAAVYM